ERVAADEALRAPIEDDLGRIIDGECEELTVTLDGVTAELTAVVGPGGRRCAVLMIPLDSREPTGDLSDLPLEEPIDSSPAIVWLKDLDGRYLRVNRQYEEQLGTNADQVCGKTDAELAEGESIDGLRLRTHDLVPKEPLELEYTVGAADGRPAFTVLRFALRDGTGKAIAVCGVAAPLAHAQLARSECERFMKIERWSRLDERLIREELLDDWGLAPVEEELDEMAGVDEHHSTNGDGGSYDGQAASAVVSRSAELEQLQRETVEMLREELSAVRETLERARTDPSHGPAPEELAAERRATQEATAAAEQARVEAARIDGLLTAEREKAEALRGELTTATDRVETLRGELAAAKEKVETLRGELGAAKEQVEIARAAAAQAGEAPTQEQLDGERTRARQAEAEARAGLERAQEELRQVREELGAAAALLGAEQQ